MLSARKAPRACQSCRLQLLSLFEYGFTSSAGRNASLLRYSTQTRLQPRYLQTRNATPIRRFTASSIKAVGPKEDSLTDADLEALSIEAEPKQAVRTDQEIAAAAIESVVRQARQTFGETLPKNYLSKEEYILYERLYGPPLRDTQPGDLEYLPQGEGEEEIESDEIRHVILRENEDGQFEEIEFDPRLEFSAVEQDVEIAEGMAMALENGEGEVEAELNAANAELQTGLEEDSLGFSTDSESSIIFQGQNQREIDAMARLQKDMDEAIATPVEEEDINEEEEYIEEEEEEEEVDEEDIDDGLTSDIIRTHPHTMAARSGTSPSTISLPRSNLTAHVAEMLQRSDPKHLMAAAEKNFGGKGLPYSTSTPSKMKFLPQKSIPLDAAQHKMSEIDADAYLAAVMPGTYSSVLSTLVEVRKRLGSQWMKELIFKEGGEGARVLDAGGAGAGVVAWREMVQAEWDIMSENGLVDGGEAPHGKSSVVTGSNTLRHRVSRFLDNTTFLPRLPDYVHMSRVDRHLDGGSAQPRKTYDVIIAPHALFPLKEDFRRKNMVENLWSLLDPNGGVLILIEKGLPRGFEAIAGARSLLLDSHISSPGSETIENELHSKKKERFTQKEDGMIIAPCTNHSSCPMYPVPGLSTGRKDFCHLGQRFIRPAYLQKVLGASVRNHEDVKFSYLAVRRGVDARKGEAPILAGDEATDQSFEGYENHDLPVVHENAEASDVKFHALSLPRAILPPLKRRGHVTLDLCTPSGKLERWTVPRSFSRIAYRDARKSKWGDLWALGAKTRIVRSPRLGRLGEEAKGKKLKGIRDGRMGKNGKKMKKTQYDIIMGDEGMEGVKEKPSRYMRTPEKRTKGGRVWKDTKSKIITEDDQ
jgi:ribosomal protein RSM22 (predicted rRNA methylase)